MAEHPQPVLQAEVLIKAFTNNPFLASILDYNLNKQGFLDQESNLVSNQGSKLFAQRNRELMKP